MSDGRSGWLVDQRGEGARAMSITADQRDVIRDSIREFSRPNRTFWLMNALATVIACYGLLSNSAAVVIGAMVVALLLGPIAGVALGLTDRDHALFSTALLSLLGGIAWILLVAIVIGAFHRDAPLTPEIISRTSPTLFDLMIALAGGAAGGIAIGSPRSEPRSWAWPLQRRWSLRSPQPGCCCRAATWKWPGMPSSSP